MTILALAAAALAAILLFRKTPEGAAAVQGDSTLTTVRRSTSVMLALAEATWAILDALTYIKGRGTAPVSTTGRSTRTPNFGNQPASDVAFAD